MAAKWTEAQAIQSMMGFLNRDIDQTDKELVQKYRASLIAVASNVRSAIANGDLVETDTIKEVLSQVDTRHFQLHFGLRFDGVTEHPPLLGEKVDTEVMLKVAEACALLGYSAPKGYTGQMFKRWGFMMGLVRQVNAVNKIGTGGFVPLAQIGRADFSAEYIVYHKALEYGEKVTEHLGKGCIERMEEVLKEHNVI
jgi:hypothetical protein